MYVKNIYKILIMNSVLPIIRAAIVHETNVCILFHIFYCMLLATIILNISINKILSHLLTVIVKFCIACIIKLETTRPSDACILGPYVLKILATRTDTFSCLAYEYANVSATRLPSS